MRAAGIQRIEARGISAPLGDRIRIVLRPIVQEVVAGEQAPARIGIQAVGAFIVAQGFVEGGGGKSAVGVRGRGNVFQQILRRPLRPGVWAPEEYFDPEAFFAEMRKRCFSIEFETENLETLKA